MTTCQRRGHSRSDTEPEPESEHTIAQKSCLRAEAREYVPRLPLRPDAKEFQPAHYYGNNVRNTHAFDQLRPDAKEFQPANLYGKDVRSTNALNQLRPDADEFRPGQPHSRDVRSTNALGKNKNNVVISKELTESSILLSSSPNNGIVAQDAGNWQEKISNVGSLEEPNTSVQKSPHEEIPPLLSIQPDRKQAYSRYLKPLLGSWFACSDQDEVFVHELSVCEICEEDKLEVSYIDRKCPPEPIVLAEQDDRSWRVYKGKTMRLDGTRCKKNHLIWVQHTDSQQCQHWFKDETQRKKHQERRIAHRSAETGGCSEFRNDVTSPRPHPSASSAAPHVSAHDSLVSESAELYHPTKDEALATSAGDEVDEPWSYSKRGYGRARQSKEYWSKTNNYRTSSHGSAATKSNSASQWSGRHDREERWQGSSVNGDDARQPSTGAKSDYPGRHDREERWHLSSFNGDDAEQPSNDARKYYPGQHNREERWQSSPVNNDDAKQHSTGGRKHYAGHHDREKRWQSSPVDGDDAEQSSTGVGKYYPGHHDREERWQSSSVNGDDAERPFTTGRKWVPGRHARENSWQASSVEAEQPSTGSGSYYPGRHDREERWQAPTAHGDEAEQPSTGGGKHYPGRHDREKKQWQSSSANGDDAEKHFTTGRNSFAGRHDLEERWQASAVNGGDVRQPSTGGIKSYPGQCDREEKWHSHSGNGDDAEQTSTGGRKCYRGRHNREERWQSSSVNDDHAEQPSTGGRRYYPCHHDREERWQTSRVNGDDAERPSTGGKHSHPGRHGREERWQSAPINGDDAEQNSNWLLWSSDGAGHASGEVSHRKAQYSSRRGGATFSSCGYNSEVRHARKEDSQALVLYNPHKTFEHIRPKEKPAWFEFKSDCGYVLVNGFSADSRGTKREQSHAGHKGFSNDLKSRLVRLLREHEVEKEKIRILRTSTSYGRSCLVELQSKGKGWRSRMEWAQHFGPVLREEGYGETKAEEVSLERAKELNRIGHVDDTGVGCPPVSSSAASSAPPQLLGEVVEFSGYGTTTTRCASKGCRADNAEEDSSPEMPAKVAIPPLPNVAGLVESKNGKFDQATLAAIPQSTTTACVSRGSSDSEVDSAASSVAAAQEATCAHAGERPSCPTVESPHSSDADDAVLANEADIIDADKKSFSDMKISTDETVSKEAQQEKEELNELNRRFVSRVADVLLAESSGCWRNVLFSDLVSVAPPRGSDEELEQARREYHQSLKLLHPDKRTELQVALAGGAQYCNRALEAVQAAWRQAKVENDRARLVAAVPPPPPPPPSSLDKARHLAAAPPPPREPPPPVIFLEEARHQVQLRAPLSIATLAAPPAPPPPGPPSRCPWPDPPASLPPEFLTCGYMTAKGPRLGTVEPLLPSTVFKEQESPLCGVVSLRLSKLGPRSDFPKLCTALGLQAKLRNDGLWDVYSVDPCLENVGDNCGADDAVAGTCTETNEPWDDDGCASDAAGGTAKAKHWMKTSTSISAAESMVSGCQRMVHVEQLLEQGTMVDDVLEFVQQTRLEV